MILEAKRMAGGLAINLISNKVSSRAVFWRNSTEEGDPLERLFETPPNTKASARLRGIVGGKSL